MSDLDRYKQWSDYVCDSCPVYTQALVEVAYARGMNDAQMRAKVEGQFEIVDSPETQALIAAAYETAEAACASLAGDPRMYDAARRRGAGQCQAAIRALTPADARAALDRRDRQMRAEGMREAAEVCTRLALDDASFIIRSRAEKVDAQ